jgi:hypothetical protein
MVGVIQESEVHRELARILESPWLRDSAALKALLRYVVEQTLAGREDGLKEYALGLEVFHRPPDYDPRSDAIVRVQASALRKKLAAFYEREGRDSRVRIDLPRGGYVPRFVDPAEPETPPPEPEPRRFAWSAFLLGMAITAIAMGIANRVPHAAAAPDPGGRAIWGPMLERDRPILVGMGMPLFFTGGNGIYMRDTQRNRSTSWPGETLLKVERALGIRFRVHNDVYTGVGEAMGVARLSRWLDRYGASVEVANSHYLGPSDIAGKDLVVVSSMRFQTLLHDMTLPTMFDFDEAGSGKFLNRRPAAGESESYGTTDGVGGVSITHALLTVLPGPTPGTRIIHAGGIHSWGTNGATQFAVDREKLRDLDRRLAEDSPEGPHGERSEWFQVLLRVEGKYDQVRAVDYVTHKYLPPTIQPSKDQH